MARARAARVSMMRLSHKSCTGRRGSSLVGEIADPTSVGDRRPEGRGGGDSDPELSQGCKRGFDPPPGQEDTRDVDGELELEELPDVLVHRWARGTPPRGTEHETHPNTLTTTTVMAKVCLNHLVGLTGPTNLFLPSIRVLGPNKARGRGVGKHPGTRDESLKSGPTQLVSTSLKILNPPVKGWGSRRSPGGTSRLSVESRIW